MKKTFTIAAIAAMAFSFFIGTPSYAVEPEEPTTIDNTARLETLQNQRDSLISAIKVEEKKRNKQINGVSDETLERMNDEQDSLCIALRSQLTDVILEIKEIYPTVGSQQILNQYNNLISRRDSVPAGAAGSK